MYKIVHIYCTFLNTIWKSADEGQSLYLKYFLFYFGLGFVCIKKVVLTTLHSSKL